MLASCETANPSWGVIDNRCASGVKRSEVVGGEHHGDVERQEQSEQGEPQLRGTVGRLVLVRTGIDGFARG